MNLFFTVLALALLLWFLALLYLRSYVKRRTSPDRILALLQEEVLQLEADIDEKTEQNLQLLEEKINTLRGLCAEAERRIAVYNRELTRKNAEEAAFAALGRAGQIPQGAAPSPENPRQKKPKSPSAKVSGRQKKAGLLDSLEIRETTAVQAAGAYKAQTQRPPAGAPPDSPLFPAVPPAPPAEVSPLPVPPSPSADLSPSPPISLGPSADVPIPPPEYPRFTVSANPISPKAPPMKERVAELYRAGFSEDLIAARLGISITEARLYIAMAPDGKGPGT
ncbi:MAG: hypothetical protein LBO65_02265 [Spirochaetaceae bacterium]|jgi:hypothetical protein|nr:hypothetical protein [Spirochaetaceae bacterium]